MNSLRKYFTSPMKSVSIDNTTVQSPSSEAMSNIPVSVPSNRKPRTDGRKIIKNMEEVLNSVKKKHKNKHKHRHYHRKKDINTKKLKTVQDINDVSEVVNGNDQQIIKPANEKNDNLINVLKCLVSPSKENILIRVKKNKKENNFVKLSKKTNNTSVDLLRLGKCSKYASKKNTAPLTALNEDVVKSEKKIIDISAEIDETINIESNENVIAQQQTKKNAFEFMMNARNKSIGRNSPGKTEMVGDSIVDTNICRVKTKRKLFLEEWADKKGGSKRKLDEDTREEYVEYLLTKRAKRLKKMIVNGNENTKIVSPNKQIQKNNTKTSLINKTAKAREKSKVGKLKDTRLSSESEKSPVQDIEFIEKLSSPLKKRDSLLGYFQKTISPNTNENKSDFSSLNKSVNTESDITSLNSRPRRSCVGKPRYDYDLDKSPTKIKKYNVNLELKSKKSAKIQIVTPEQAEDNEDPDVICLDDSYRVGNISIESQNNEVPKKLAPVFVKTPRKPNIDPKILEARHAFLMSGVPEKMKQEIAKQKHFEEIYESSVEIFPKICHVPQWENDNVENVKWENLGIIWIKKESPEKLSVQLKKKKRQSSSIFKCNNKDIKIQKSQLISLTSLPQLKNKITLIKSWKNLFEKFPTYKCYNQLREKYRYFSAVDTVLDTQQIAESFVVTKRTRNNLLPKLNKNEESDELPPDAAPNGELLFTEKYKPMSSEQILVNLTPVNTLKEFLLSWQEDGRIQKLNDSMEDFEYNNDSNNSITSNAIVLLGPNSSGKTQAVFALADELNFNILEVNAGMKRTGKKLLQELQEATQSHQIRKDSKGKLVKKKMQKIQSKKTDINFESSASSELSCNGKMSLILVEDADITFDQYDAGYIDAIYQLSSISKRPVVIIANNRNCPYLLRLINLNSVEFSAPNALNISKYLSVLSLIENCPIDLDEIISLYLFNNMDIRKTILEIQFFIQTGGDRIRSSISNSKLTKNDNEKYYASPTKRRLSLESYQGTDECMLKDDKNDENNIIYIHNTLFELFTRSQNFSTIIPYPVNLNLLWTNLSSIFQMSKNLMVSKRKISKSLQLKNTKKDTKTNEIEVLNTLVGFYENISVATCLSSIEIYDRLTLNIEEDISHFLIENSIQSTLKAKQISYNLCADNSKKRINLTCNTTNTVYSSKAKYLDYEACLRSICRSEKNRSSLERRGTRFYHYLRNNYIQIDTFSTELFNNASSILMDNTELDNSTTELYEN